MTLSEEVASGEHDLVHGQAGERLVPSSYATHGWQGAAPSCLGIAPYRIQLYGKESDTGR